MDNANDAVMVDAAPKPRNPDDYSDLLHTSHSDAFAFSEREQLVLELYDQLRELELEQSLLKAQNEDDVLQDQLIVAEREVMDAKARYELRNRITHNVLVMDPVLKAVHGGEHTGYAEKRILPLISENDVVSMVHNTLASKLTSTTHALNAAEKENITVNEKNRELARSLLALAEELKARSTEDIEDPRLREQVTDEEKGLKESRRRMMTLKGIVSGMVVGSGIDWAEDDALRGLVMDEEDG
ncbi:uncharacterized protein BDR25DRAFT_271316 [Lindgomyces ingoldianus]|uniref:Uncharacterized protein n=1 Tax=Lindgomyces ingoldianus TaxID=673940 RepID=A0ACB6QCM8_9PLEO|nr:uncharacterized protein BDR25DRAFT_271316 [Lindgomyces ingoldianus]KAF2464703.1 hypothetical protein BDR25DRAFT_271316 [Lindgomyces ingoldianus]